MSNQNEFKSHDAPVDDRDDEISLGQIIGFFIESWKQLGFGAAAGVVLGLAGVMVFGAYKAEMILDNSSKKAIDFTSWRVLETKLPLLAARVVESKLTKPEEEDQFKRLSRSDWWQKNVVPTYSLSKTDTKNLVAISKDLQDAEGSSILYLKVTSSDTSQEKSEKNLKISANFIRSGSAYLTLKSLLDGYESSVQTKEADLQRKITAAEIERAFMNQKAQNLEEMHRRFPGNAKLSSNQILDPKDSGAKYFPISIQLVAINTDINNANETLVRMRDELAQQKIIRMFLDQATPAVAGQADGLVLADRLLAIEAELRKKLDAKDMKQQQVADNIHAELVALRTRFGKGMDASGITTTRSSYLIPALGAGISGGFLALLILLGRRSWRGLKVK